MTMQESLRVQVESELKMARNKIADITKKIETRKSPGYRSLRLFTSLQETTKSARKNGVAMEGSKRKFSGQPLQVVPRPKDESDERGAFTMELHGWHFLSVY